MPSKCVDLPEIVAFENRKKKKVFFRASWPAGLSHVIELRVLVEVEKPLRLIPDLQLPHGTHAHTHVPTHMQTRMSHAYTYKQKT